MSEAQARQGAASMNDIAPTSSLPEALERVLIMGDLSILKPQERIAYYKAVCTSVGLNPLTKPFDYIELNKKLTLYALKNATDQLRSIHQVSVNITSREVTEGCYVVTAKAVMPNGRTDESIGAVSIQGLKGDMLCNQIMKGETKAKRRVTLSICGLGMLDETEIETVPGAKIIPNAEAETEPITLTHNRVLPSQEPDTPTTNGVQKGADISETIPESPVKKLKKKLEDTSGPYISMDDRSYLAQRFRESLPKAIEGDNNVLRHHVLGELARLGKFKSKLIDDAGNPTSEFILKEELNMIGKEMIRQAKALGS